MTGRRTAAITAVVLLAGVLPLVETVVGPVDAGAAIVTTTAASWSDTLSCTQWRSVKVPTNVNSVTYKLWGGGGAAGDNYKYINTASGGDGGAGALVQGTITGLTAGTYLSVKIGCGGSDGTGASPGYINGGGALDNTGGGGGAASALCASTTSGTCTTVLAIASGGGGGGRGQTNLVGARYAGGAGGNGSSGSSATNRNGGSTVTGADGENGGNCCDGEQGKGGAGSSKNLPPDTTTPPGATPSFGAGTPAFSGAWNSGGGGGGGLIGGAGAKGGQNGGNYRAPGGGGAGSSWFRTSGSIKTASSSVGNAGGVTNCSSASIGINPGYGGNSQTVGCPGYVVISWDVQSASTVLSTSPSSTGTAGLPLDVQPVVTAENTSLPLGGVADEMIRLTIDGSATLLDCSTNPLATNLSGKASFVGCRFETEGTYRIRIRNMTTGAELVTGNIVISSNNNWSDYTLTDPTCGVSQSYTLPLTANSASSIVGKGGGGGGGAGGANSNTGGNGASGSTVEVENLALNPVLNPSVNYISGCGGGKGISHDQDKGSSTATGGAGGAGWGAGGTAGTVSGGDNRHTSGGGGGGSTAICLGAVGQTCDSGVPILVAGGGAGGGGTSAGNPSHGGSYGTASTGSSSWYGTGPAGTYLGGRGGERGNDAAGAGGGGGGGVSGQGGGSSTVGGTGGGTNAAGGGGGGYGGGVQNGSGGNGKNGGASGYGSSNSRRASGGGGGGGYYGGGGGGGDTGSTSPGGGGGGSGSSWATNSTGQRTLTWNGGGAGGSGGSPDSNGYNGSGGSASITLGGKGIVLTRPADRTDDVGSGYKALTVNAVTSTVDGHISPPDYTISGAPPGWMVSEAGEIAGPAPTVAGSYSITLTASMETDSFVTPPNITLTQSVTFTWTFKPAAASRLMIVEQLANPSPVGDDLAFTVQVQDQFGNRIPGATNTVSLSLTTNPTAATLNGTISTGAVSGTATFHDFSIDRSGFGYQLTASSAGLQSAVTDPFDAVIIGGTSLTLTNGPEDPDLLNNDLPGSEVASVTYYRCPGWTTSVACASPTVIGTSSATADDFAYTWTSPPAGDYRILAVQTDNVGNSSPLSAATTPSTPVRIIGNALWVEYLVVAGGGAGGPNTGGGGGAGGLLTGTTMIADTSNRLVTVGVGGIGDQDGYGLGPSGYNGVAQKGSDSIFAGVATAKGGGPGGGNQEKNGSARQGGSGGGAGHDSTPTGQGTVGQGNNSGASPGSTGPNYGASGGGGRGSTGGNGTSTKAGAGGLGYFSSITGTPVAYAGGGGGGCYNAGGSPQTCSAAGGSGVGGNGGIPLKGGDPAAYFVPTSGIAGSGSGGGGQAANVERSGGSGGSGIVVIRYKSPTKRAEGGTATQVGDYWVHVFTVSDNFTKTS